MDKILHDPKDPKTMGIMVYSLFNYGSCRILSINRSTTLSLNNLLECVGNSCKTGFRCPNEEPLGFRVLMKNSTLKALQPPKKATIAIAVLGK